MRDLSFYYYKKSRTTMKKLFRLVAIMLACLAIADCNAQSTWHFGVKAGLNLADEAMKNEATDMVAGLHVGAIANYRLNDLFDIEADIVYSQQGVVDKGIEVMDNSGMEASDTHLQFRSQYINVPLTLKWFGNDHFYAEGGPQFGYQLARKLSLFWQVHPRRTYKPGCRVAKPSSFRFRCASWPRLYFRQWPSA